MVKDKDIAIVEAQSAQAKVIPTPQENIENQETFKEHYPLLLPFSYAAIVEDEKNEVKYSVLEPTLTDLDKQLVDEIKSILWDELAVNTKSFKDKEEAEDFLQTEGEKAHY